MTRCRFVDDHRADYLVAKQCGLVESPRATHYSWRAGAVSERLIDDAHLPNKIVDIHR